MLGVGVVWNVSRVVWLVVWALAFGAVGFGLTLWLDVKLHAEMGNLTPPAAVVLGGLASLLGVGCALASVIARIRGLAIWQAALLPPVALALIVLAVLHLSGAWPRNDSYTLVRRIGVVSELLRRQGIKEGIVYFHPPRRAGNYEIIIAGDEMPTWIAEQPLERLWVQYPAQCGRLEADSKKPFAERTGPEMSSSPTCGGLLWGAGWSFGGSRLERVPVTLWIAKGAGETTEIVLRKRRGVVEVVELR